MSDNRLFVARKPMFIGSNKFLSQIKRKYNVKKAGFSGTLDPFACGVLIIAFGQYTKLFRFLKKSPKTYRAVLWLGVSSPTLDIEKIDKIENIPPFEKDLIYDAVSSFKGTFTYYPPKFSAKRVDGKRAYDLAREGKSVKLHQISSTIHSIKIINYNHPFVTFEATVSEGTYIRSLAEAIAQKLRCNGTLSYLERIHEGKFVYENEKPLNPLDFLQPPLNHYLGDPNDLILGKKLSINQFEISQPGVYTVVFDKYFAIIEIKDSVYYLLNKVKLC